MRRSAPTAVAVALLALAPAGCREDTVRVTFRPEVGATYRYEVEVRSESEIRIGGEEPLVRDEQIVLTAEHTVLAAGEDDVEVEVVLSEPGADDRRFVVLFDRAAQLEEVVSIEGVPEDVLGALGISEIFPAAAGAPPDRPLGPGARWEIDDVVRLPDAAKAVRLTGDGRLVELGVVDGEKVARLASAATLPVLTTVPSPQGDLRLDGVQVTDYLATHDLSDGAVRRASSSTVGRFALEVSPPEGLDARPESGTLVVRVDSTTRRL